MLPTAYTIKSSRACAPLCSERAQLQHMPACRGLSTPAHSDPGRRREKRCYGTSEQAGNNEEMTDNPLKLVLDRLEALRSEVGGLRSEVGGLRSEMGGRMDALGRQIGNLNESYLLANASSMFGNEYARQLLARTGQDLLRQFPRSTIASDSHCAHSTSD